MTYEEAKAWVLGCIRHDGFVETKRGDLTNQVIKEALEKQIPKKPKLYDGDWQQAMCPMCNEDLNSHWIWGGITYCEGCGQAIDWSKE